MPRPDVSAERKAQILEAAERIFAREGPMNVRMEHIAAEAGLSVGILYWYFKDKDDLIYQLLITLTEQDLLALDSLVQMPERAEEKLQNIFVLGLERSLNLAPLFYAFYARALVTPELKVIFQGYYERYLDILTRLIEQGVAQGTFRPLAVREAARALLALYLGLIEMTAMGSSSNPPEYFAHAAQMLLQSWKA